MNELAVIETELERASAVRPTDIYLSQLAPRSRRVILSDLNTIAGIIAAGTNAYTLPWQQVRHEHVAAVRARLAERYAPATANRMLSAFRGVLKACWQLRLTTTDDYHRAVDVKPVRGERIPRGRALPSGEMRALFAVCADGTNDSRRDSALLAILYAGGLRREEVVSLELADYTDGMVTVRSGKGNKDRTVYLAPAAQQAVADWLAVRGIEPGPLLMPVRRDGTIVWRSMTGQAVFGVIVKRAQQAGIKPMSPHDARRSCATDLLELGVNISTVSKILGHADIKTTAKYDRSGEVAKSNAANKLHVPYGVS